MSSQSQTQLQGKRDAVRILFLIAKAGEAVGRNAPEDMVVVVHAEKRMQALDFWMRNPDYLAYELLDQFEQDPKNKDLLKAAEQVMTGDEPDIRRLAMQRFLFGAWEALDDAVATLSLPGLVEMHRKFSSDGKKIQKTSYYLTKCGAEKTAELETIDPLDWYAKRAELVARTAGERNGHQLKSIQYKVAEYNDAKHGTLIAPIGDEVASRIKILKEKV